MKAPMNDDKSLLHACVVDDMDLIKARLVNVKPAHLKKSTQETGTPLHAAAMNENKEAVDLLIAAGANIEGGNFLGNNAMLACIEAGKLDMAKYLIEKGTDINKKGCQNRNALSQLILYSWNRNFAAWLLENGCGINQTALDKQTLLSDAASSNNGDAIDFLLANGIDPGYANSALCWAIIHNGVDAVKLLLDKGASLEAMYDACKGIEKSLYHDVMTRESTKGKGRIPLLRLLLDRGVDFTKAPERAISMGIDKTKLSPLEYAKEHLQKWPAATYISENIAIVERQQAQVG